MPMYKDPEQQLMKQFSLDKNTLDVKSKKVLRFRPTNKKPDYNNPRAKNLIKMEINRMKNTINDSVAGSRIYTEGKYGGDVDVTGQKSTFPKWFQKIKAGTEKNFIAAAERGKGTLYNRIKEQAINRLENGYEDEFHGRDMPDVNFKVATGQLYDNRQVIFRNIGGRIVPIKVKYLNRRDLVPF